MVRPSNLYASFVSASAMRETVQKSTGWTLRYKLQSEGIWESLLLVVHSIHSSISLGVAAETNETEATAAVGVTILDNDLRIVKESSVWFGKVVTIKKIV
jgi:hypothetical protein